MSQHNAIVWKPFQARPYGDMADSETRILEQMKFYVSDWEQLNWYVEMTKRDIRRLSPKHLKELQKEFTVLNKALWYPQAKCLFPSKAIMSRLQSVIRKHLEELSDSGHTKMGPFRLCVEVERPLSRLKDSFGGFTKKELAEIDGHTHQTILISGNGLLFHLSELLKKYGGSMRRCPHCSNLFLQFRRSATYCSRKCQSIAAMKAIRSVQPQKKAKGRNEKHKKGIHHGEKRRKG